MRHSYQLPLMGLLLFSLIPSQLCKICEVNEENYSYLKHLLNTMINSEYTSKTQSANVLLSLRLVGIHNQTLKQQVERTTEGKPLNFTSGQLAVIILALEACHPTGENFTYKENLLRSLEEKFQDEIENMKTHDGNPLTNFYQISLDVLTLCLFNGNYSTTEVAELFNHTKNYYLGGQFSVDTGAMAVLALTCVNRTLTNEQIKAEKNLTKIDECIRFLVKKILSEKKENGLIGNTFSTGVAMQALFVSSKCYGESEWNCQQTLTTIFKEISRGMFNNPTAAAQILPPLMGRTYLNVTSFHCDSDLDKINISNDAPESNTPSNSSSSIHVHYSVVIINETYPTNITVPNGSVFLDVMKKAQKQNPTKFRFTMEQSAWGPYITSVQGLYANNNKRTYWELLSGGKSLSQGVGSYVVHNGENLEVRWSKY
ncbi:transcobalamin 1 [Ictidomys tridecemlineatus]|uniref:Transcobalamin 1 n=1 Tax=Ictidomys tridecemlineatus TaxID=43179 RepID=I3M9E8_ICTTR|nr:transcobalamin-1 [Ictidomys tridecemlineatus]KAG3284955.1 transcobalamin 1 [Ictidomys tridecemlineatus]